MKFLAVVALLVAPAFSAKLEGSYGYDFPNKFVKHRKGAIYYASDKNSADSSINANYNK